jgi:hypothetical protein
MNVTDEEDPGSPFFLTKSFGLREGFSFYVWTSQPDILLSRDYLNQYYRRKK